MRKEIPVENNAEIIEELLQTNTKAPETVSLRKFIDMNYQAFACSGKTVQEIYDFLKGKNIDVSSFSVFRSLYSKVKSSHKQKLEAPIRAQISEEIPAAPKESTQVVPGKEHKTSQNGGEPDARKEPQPNDKVSKYNPMLPPVILPGGIEAIIDPKTGAKSFEI